MWSYSQDLRDRVIEAVENGASARSAAARFRVSPSTAVKWVQRWRREGMCRRRPMGPARGCSPLELEKDFLNRVMEEKPDITLKAVQERLLAERGMAAALSSLSRFYTRHGWRFKKNSESERTRSS